MNVRRVAALLRELADALEQPVDQAKAIRKRPAAEPTVTPSKAVIEEVQRKLRRKGIAA